MPAPAEGVPLFLPPAGGSVPTLSPTLPTHPTANPTEASIQTGRRVLIAGVPPRGRAAPLPLPRRADFLQEKRVRGGARVRPSGPSGARTRTRTRTRAQLSGGDREPI